MKHDIPIDNKGRRQLPVQKVDIKELTVARHFDGSLWIEYKGKGKRLDENTIYPVLKKHWGA